MCIVLYLKLIWCNGFTDIYASLEACGVNLPWVYVYCAIYELVCCNGFPDTYDWLEERDWHQSAIGICALCYIYLSVDLPSLVYWYSRHLCLSQGGQSAIDPCYTITPPLPINHRLMLHHYTSPAIDHRSMLHCYTHMSHI